MRSNTTRVLRGVPGHTVRAAEIERLETLPYTMDGRPISAELRAAKDAGFRKGWDQGWRDGHERGRDEALRTFSATLAPAIAAIEAAVAQLRSLDTATGDQVTAEVVEFAYQVASAVVGRELRLADEPWRDAVHRAVGLIPERGDVVVRLHPDDFAHVDAAEVLIPGRGVQLVADRSVERGGAVAQVGPCRVDAQISTALERVRDALGFTS